MAIPHPKLPFWRFKSHVSCGSSLEPKSPLPVVRRKNPSSTPSGCFGQGDFGHGGKSRQVGGCWKLPAPVSRKVGGVLLHHLSVVYDLLVAPSRPVP